jgi:ATP-dependent DNA ligase
MPTLNQSHGIEPAAACTYPARPLNGGALERALPKPGEWHYEPKYNGWRALVHGPSGTMFNRYGQRLSIQGEFSAALATLRTLRLSSGAVEVEWWDCEALARRHALGRGTLLVFDYIGEGGETYVKRKENLARRLTVHDPGVPPRADTCYSVVAATLDPLEFYHRLKQWNGQWHCPFYEGVVAKRADSLYPVQRRSATLEFAGWMKHRWAGA